MDETDLAKAGANALMKPITNLIEKIAGPGAEEIGLTIQDHIRVYRAKRQIALLRKMQIMIDRSGFEPQRIPIKVLLPIDGVRRCRRQRGSPHGLGGAPRERCKSFRFVLSVTRVSGDIYADLCLRCIFSRPSL